MKSYRCYFSDRDSRLRAIRHIVCADHADAIAIASRLLKQNLYTAAELWHCDQFIGQLLNESDAKAVAEAADPLSTGLDTLQVEAQRARGGDR
jgi:hypothetical protein